MISLWYLQTFADRFFRILWKESLSSDDQQFHQYQ
jgi:hypothetical protein